jgi:hypothetical protein
MPSRPRRPACAPTPSDCNDSPQPATPVPATPVSAATATPMLEPERAGGSGHGLARHARAGEGGRPADPRRRLPAGGAIADALAPRGSRTVTASGERTEAQAVDEDRRAPALLARTRRYPPSARGVPRAQRGVSVHPPGAARSPLGRCPWLAMAPAMAQARLSRGTPRSRAPRPAGGGRSRSGPPFVAPARSSSLSRPSALGRGAQAPGPHETRVGMLDSRRRGPAPGLLSASPVHPGVIIEGAASSRGLDEPAAAAEVEVHGGA